MTRPSAQKRMSEEAIAALARTMAQRGIRYTEVSTYGVWLEEEGWYETEHGVYSTSSLRLARAQAVTLQIRTGRGWNAAEINAIGRPRPCTG